MTPGHVLLQPGGSLEEAFKREDVVMVQLVGGGVTPFEAPLEVPRGRNLTITASSLGNRDGRSGAAMRVKVNAAIEVLGTLQLIGIEVVSKGKRHGTHGPGSYGSAPSAEVPLVTIREGGTVEIIQSELRVVAGAPAIESFNGLLVLRESTIMLDGERSSGGSRLLQTSSSVSPPKPLVHLHGSRLELGTDVRLESQDAATWDDMLAADSTSVISFSSNVSGLQTLSEKEAAEACPAGSARNSTTNECLTCPPASFSTSVESQTCTQCPEGSYQADAGQTDCSNCTAGSFCVQGSVKEQPCPAGTFAPTTGQSACQNCTAGMYCRVGAKRGGRCSEGFFCPARSQVQQPCPAGRFGGEKGLVDNGCSGTCAKGFYCESGSLSAKAAPCLPGSYGNTTGLTSQEDCHACPAGASCLLGATSPTPCAAGTVAENTSAGECTQCVAGSFQSKKGETVCNACSIGGYCPFGASLVQPCAAGSFGNSSGLASQAGCSACPPGHACSLGARAASPCAAGTIAPNASSGECAACEAGGYQSAVGATACDTCTSGAFCVAGAVSPSLCAAGTYSNITGNSKRGDCADCPMGTFCVTGATWPEPCAAGSFSSSERAATCAVCEAGTYQRKQGSTACEVCRPGYKCPVGSVVEIPISCDAGKYLNTSSMECLICEAGSQCAGGTSQPKLCPRGSFAAQAGTQECPACSPGTFQQTKGATACEECVPGHFCIEGATTPMPCTAGTYANTTGAASGADCEDVMMGYYSPAGSVLPVECPGWGFCPGRAHDTENGDHPGSIPTVIAQGKRASLTTINEAIMTNVTTLDLPIELEMKDETALNETAVRLHVALLLDLPLEAVSLSRSQEARRRLDVRVVFTVSIDPTLVSSAEMAALAARWSRGGEEMGSGAADGAFEPLAALLSEALGAEVNVSKAIAPVSASRIITLNRTITRLVLTDCGPGYWGANGKCIACSKGTYKPDGSVSECLSCPPGSYQPSTSAIDCLQCTPGYYCAESAVLALPCPGGTRMNKSLPVMTREEDCIVCPIGTACPVGSEKAIPCGAGTYSDIERQASCRSCAPGSFADAEGATACKQCQAGGYCPRGASIPLPCKAGFFSNRNNLSLASQCELCLVGHACTTGSIEPVPCSPGSIAPTTGLATCQPCKPGTFQPDFGGVSCLGCGAGNYSANILSCEPCQVNECNPI